MYESQQQTVQQLIILGWLSSCEVYGLTFSTFCILMSLNSFILMYTLKQKYAIFYSHLE